jgi:hypothetical protein
MKKIILSLAFAAALVSCNSGSENSTTTDSTTTVTTDSTTAPAIAPGGDTAATGIGVVGDTASAKSQADTTTGATAPGSRVDH